MAQTYTRQSSIADGDTITAALFNNEYNQLLNAFAYSSSSASSTGHSHDGTAAQGGNIYRIGDLDFLNKIESDSTNNRWGFYVEVSSAAVEQIRIQDGAIVPVTDNDIDLGTSSVEFKDAYFDGTVTTDALVADTADINGGTVDGATVGANSASSGAFTTITASSSITGSGTVQGTTITATTAFVPDASDGAALGTSSLEFSDLFLADGAVINFGDDQDVSLTHVADTGLLLSSTDQLQFGDSGTYIHQSADGVLDLVSDTEIEINATTIDINGNVDISGTLTVAGALDFGDAALSNVGDVQLDSIAGDGDTNTSITFSGSDVITITAGGDAQFTFNNGSILPSTDNDIDLGSSSYEFKDAYFDGTVTTDALVADTADINGGSVDGATLGTNSAITQAVIDNVNINGATIGHTDDTDLITLADGVVTVAGELDATTLDISGNADIDGTLEADAYTVDGTALATYIRDTVGTNMVSSNTESGITVTYDTTNDNIDFAIDAAQTTITSIYATDLIMGEDSQTAIDFGTANEIDFKVDNAARLTLTASALYPVTDNQIDLGTSSLEFKDAYFDGTVTSDAFAGPLTGDVTGTSSKVTVSDSTANTNFPVVFHDESDSLLDDTGALRYNPSSGTLLVPNLSVAGTTTTVDTVTMEASNAIIFEGATADAHETTLSIVDPTGDRTINLPNVSGTIPVLAAASTTQISSTPEELNILDGATVVVGEINALDLGSTAVGTAIASKAVILDSNKDYTGIRNLTITGELDGATLDISGNADIDGTTNLDAVDIDGTVQIDGATTFGVDDTGVDVKFFGATSGAYLLWDESADKLLTAGGAVVDIVKDKLLIGGTAVTTTAAELNVLDAVTAGTVTASLGVVVDSNKDIGSFRNITLTGELDAGSLDVSGDADIDGTLETDALTINGSALNYKAFGTSSIMFGDNATGTIDAANYNTGLGVNVFAALTSGDGNSAIGYGALTANTTGSQNNAIGNGALGANTTGDNNIGVGTNALTSNTTGSGNTAVGQAAGENVTTGSYNTAVGGYGTLDANTTANNNTAIGAGVMTVNTTGASNTAVGAYSLDANTTGDDNVAVGYGALSANTTADYNTAVGKNSLAANTTGSQNTAVGQNAGDAITTGSANTCLGQSALSSTTTANNNTAIGVDALNANTTGSENVGVGIYALDGCTTGTNNTAVGYHALGGVTTSDNNVALGFRAGQDITTGGRNTCIGEGSGISGSPSGSITTSSNIMVLGDDNLGTLYCTQGTINTSDKRDKTNITDFDGGLDWINKMKPVTYQWDRRSWYVDEDASSEDILAVKPDGSLKKPKVEVGLIAQDVLEIEKEHGFGSNNDNSLLVDLTEDETRYGINYTNIVPMLINAVQELSAKVEELEKKLSEEN